MAELPSGTVTLLFSDIEGSTVLLSRLLGITHKRTRPYRPQTNGKIERFHRTLAQGWAFKRFYNTESARRMALPSWIHEYNHHRPHTAIGKATPISRLTNLPEHYI